MSFPNYIPNDGHVLGFALKNNPSALLPCLVWNDTDKKFEFKLLTGSEIASLDVSKLTDATPPIAGDVLTWNGVRYIPQTPQSGVTGKTLLRSQLSISGAPQGTISITGDKNSIVKTIDDYAMGVNPTKSVKILDTGAEFQAGAFGAIAIVTVVAVTQITNLEIWKSNTVNTANGTKIIDVPLIPIGLYYSLLVKVDANQFITVKGTGTITIDKANSALLNLGE